MRLRDDMIHVRTPDGAAAALALRIWRGIPSRCPVWGSESRLPFPKNIPVQCMGYFSIDRKEKIRMTRITRRCIFTISLALLAATAEAHARQADPSDLTQATRLVNQSRKLVRDAHRRDPHGFGGHEAKAAALLRRAALELNEAHDFRHYNAERSPHPACRATHRTDRDVAVKVFQKRVSG